MHVPGACASGLRPQPLDWQACWKCGMVRKVWGRLISSVVRVKGAARLARPLHRMRGFWVCNHGLAPGCTHST